jgi:hypothetical protein
MKDFLDRDLQVSDIVLVINAEGNMDLAMVTGTSNEWNILYPTIRRFKDDYVLSKKETVYKKNTIFIVNSSVPMGFYRKKLEFLEQNANLFNL